jgi:hypothetical protein
MTTSTFALSHAHPVQMYFHNLGRAARFLGAALVAAAPLPPEAQTSASQASLKFAPHDVDENRAATTDMLYSLASQFESTQPNQAAELRWLASHG